VQTKSLTEETAANLQVSSPIPLHVSTILKYDDQCGAITDGIITQSETLMIQVDLIPSTDASYED
jgi:hypothetical protein